MTRECRRSHFNRCRVSTCFLPLSHFLSFFPTSCHLASLPPIKIYFVSFGSRSTCFIPVSLKLYIYIFRSTRIYENTLAIYLFIYLFFQMLKLERKFTTRKEFLESVFLFESILTNQTIFLYTRIYSTLSSRQIKYKHINAG